MVKLGQEKVNRFVNDMKVIFGPNIKANCKDNSIRIAEKISEIMIAKNLPASEAWENLTDILRGQIFCRTPKEVHEVIRKMTAQPYVCGILRFKPRFSGFLADMVVNFNYQWQMCAELQIKLGDGKLSRGFEE